MLLEFHSKITIKKLDRFSDYRGWLTEIFRKDIDKIYPVMAYISYTKRGAVRGPHEHKKQTDNFIFAGPGNVELYVWESWQHAKIIVGEKNPVMVTIPPGVVHGYKALSNAIIINLPDTLYKGVNKQEEIDEIRWEDDPTSPYII